MSTIYGNALIIPSKGGESGGASGETTSLKVETLQDNVACWLFCLWQTSDGWAGTGTFEATESFTIPNVIVGGYVIITREPNATSQFSTIINKGMEDIGVGAMSAEWDVADAALVMKVTAPSPSFILHLRS